MTVPSRFLTRNWNNILTLAFGLALVAFAVAALSTSIMSDRAAFIATVLFGAVY